MIPHATTFFDGDKIVAKPGLLAKLFGRRFVSIYGDCGLAGIVYDGCIFFTHEFKVDNGFYQLPKGFSVKHMLPPIK